MLDVPSYGHKAKQGGQLRRFVGNFYGEYFENMGTRR